VACKDSIDGGSADLAQAMVHLGREVELSVSFQVLGRFEQGRLQAFATDVIQRLGYHQQRGFHVWAVGATALSLSRLALQVTAKKLDKILPIQARDGDQLVQDYGSLLAWSLDILPLLDAQVLSCAVDTHLSLCGHVSLRLDYHLRKLYHSFTQTACRSVRLYVSQCDRLLPSHAITWWAKRDCI